MTSSLNEDIKQEGRNLHPKMCNENILLDSDHVSNNNFSSDQFQNFDTQQGQNEAPLTPFNMLSNNHYRSVLSMQNNSLLSLFTNREMMNPQYFSPMQEPNNLVQMIFSPEVLSSRMLRDDASISHLHNQPFNFTDFDNQELICTPQQPNILNHSAQTFHYPSSYSFQNSQRNTPLNPMCASPRPSLLQSGSNLNGHMMNSLRLGGNHGLQTTSRMQNLIGSAQNNIFHQNHYIPQQQQQSSQNSHLQSPDNNNINQQVSYDQYNNFGLENDPFDDMDLQDWVSGQKSDGVKEEDERSQSFLGQILPLKKKIKLDDADIMRRMEDEQLNEINSCTQEERDGSNKIILRGQQQTYKHTKDNIMRGKMNQEGRNSRVLNSSEKTLKHNFYISPENDKFSRSSATPVKNNENIYNFMTPTTLTSKHKVKEEDMDDVHNHLSTTDKKDDKSGGRNGRGLRILSKKVKDIVCDLKETSYKQVAEYLIKDMEAKKQNSLEFAKDEQNVKRRVYDALNVLIAASVLSKDGKKVKADQTLPKGNTSSQNPHQKKEYLEKALISKRTRLIRKHDTVNDLIMKFVSLKSLCERNAVSEKRGEEHPTQSKSPTSQSFKCITLQQGTQKKENDSSEKKKLRFPFIGVYSPSDNSRISFKKFNYGLLVSSIQQLNLQGDIDILVKLYSYSHQSLINQDKMKYLRQDLLEFMEHVSELLRENSENVEEDEDIQRQHDNEQQLQMEITITNNKHIEQRHHPIHLLNNNNSKLLKSIQQQKNEDDPPHARSQDDDSSQETINQIKKYTSQKQQIQQPLDIQITSNNNNHNNNISFSKIKFETPQQDYAVEYEYEDSNQLVNDYIN